MIAVNTCRSCGAVIIWMRTEAGKSIPVDAESAKEPALLFNPKVHVSHFATCPQSKSWRKSR